MSADKHIVCLTKIYRFAFFMKPLRAAFAHIEIFTHEEAIVANHLSANGTEIKVVRCVLSRLLPSLLPFPFIKNREHNLLPFCCRGDIFLGKLDSLTDPGFSTGFTAQGTAE